MKTSDFKRVMRGYDPEAVDQAWTEMEDQLSVVNATNKELRLQINSLREQNTEWGNRLKHYEEIENDLRDALLTAQRTASQLKDDAAKQAEELLNSARSESETMLSEANRIFESKELEIDRSLIGKREEIVRLEEKIAQLNEEIQILNKHKTELFTQADQAIRYLEIIKDLLEDPSPFITPNADLDEHSIILAEEDNPASEEDAG